MPQSCPSAHRPGPCCWRICAVTSPG